MLAHNCYHRTRSSIGLLCASLLAAPGSNALADMATGYVFEDLNHNESRDASEPGIPNARVSNGREITETDADGHWELPYDDDTVFFVIKPSGWAVPLDNYNRPRFHYVHRPDGSPDFNFPGVPPTGPLPESIDFPLTRANEPERFEVILFGDPQPRDQTEVDYITHDVVESLIGSDAKFGVTLGDIVFDDLALFEPLSASIAMIGIPWYNVIGNHDINFDATNDADSDETFTRHFGPSYYAFDYGPVHFIALDDIYWEGARPEGAGRYHAELGEDQLEFIKNDLNGVPKEKLVVVMMHIPIMGIVDREPLYRLLEQRPYNLSVSGHTHWQAHKLLRKEDGWLAPTPHHHIVNVTVSGSWWGGAPDEFGIPHTMMRDGAPNGYTTLAFDGEQVRSYFRAARREADFQMSIHAPERVTSESDDPATFYANVFNGWERSTVEYRIDAESDWRPMTHTIEKDPYYVAVHDRENSIEDRDYRNLSGPVDSDHLWKADLPTHLSPGVHRIAVRATDVNGEWIRADRLFSVD